VKKIAENIVAAAVVIGVVLLMLLAFYKVFGYILELDNDDKKRLFCRAIKSLYVETVMIVFW